MHRQRLHQATIIPFASFLISSFRHQAFHQPRHHPLRDTDTPQSTLLLHKPPATPPATQRHWHATKHTSSSQATSHSETLTRHKAHFLFTRHQSLRTTDMPQSTLLHKPLRETDTPQSTLPLHKPPATPPATQRHWHATKHTPLHKPPAPHLLKTLTTFYGTHKFTTMFVRTHPEPAQSSPRDLILIL
jgi:hypothetical protein